MRIKSAISSTGHKGLQILTQISDAKSNIVVKSGLNSLTKIPIMINLSTHKASCSSSLVKFDEDYCFLKSCHLCNKPLSPDKDIFMYRGDQGFCSVECRSRQIMVDEAKELEEKFKKKISSTSSSMECRGCETCRLLEDFRQRRHRRNIKPFTPTNLKHQPLLSFS